MTPTREPSVTANDFDDPALYEPVGMRPQCSYIAHWRSCRLDEGHGGKHSPGSLDDALRTERLRGREEGVAIQVHRRQCVGDDGKTPTLHRLEDCPHRGLIEEAANRILDAVAGLTGEEPSDA